eukprot:CAMPEP_0174719350 /NCGR_PEP_ID=MMETSP1094-20130205/30928_1 /TAXON_ID=156173 /ORGANISM="Chrysochromulina brevifilum, Strain UTEX LB 985" /LENGTH=373 /DNA_ID=CAMNT_0015919635 /DNA_START=34 /DNA_END=1155 /DNA_ORIENTATION=-
MSGLAEPLMPAEESSVGPRRLTADERIQRLFKAAATVADDHKQEGLSKCLVASQPIATITIKGIMIVWPMYVWLYTKAYDIYLKLPKNAITMIFGAALCFFGGTFCTSIAAIEAFRMTGGSVVYGSIAVVVEDVKSVLTENVKDDKVDDDENGIADVDELSPTDLAKRKITMAMKAVNDPERLQTAVAALWTAYIAVLATLKLEFAQTTALALGIVEVVKLPLVRALATPVSQLLGSEISKWAEVLIDSTIKFVAILFAWFLQMFISAFYSAIRGGRMFADAFFALLLENDNGVKCIECLPFVSKPFDPNTSFLDEGVAYTLTAAGFTYQVMSGFTLPFPLNLIFLPLTIIEWFLRWQVTFASPESLNGAASG